MSGENRDSTAHPAMLTEPLITCQRPSVSFHSRCQRNRPLTLSPLMTFTTSATTSVDPVVLPSPALEQRREISSKRSNLVVPFLCDSKSSCLLRFFPSMPTNTRSSEIIRSKVATSLFRMACCNAVSAASIDIGSVSCKSSSSFRCKFNNGMSEYRTANYLHRLQGATGGVKIPF